MVEPSPPIKFPTAAFLVITTQFCDSFHYFGVKSVMIIYLTIKLGYSDNTATSLYHGMVAAKSFLVIFGAIIADELGRFRTIILLSFIYFAGSVLNTLGSISPLHLPAREMTMIGLTFLILGLAGIAPNVGPFGGNQFKLPEQKEQLQCFFLMFYFTINAGHFISALLGPTLRHDIHCFGAHDCFPAAFGFPTFMMFLAIVIFLSGWKIYVIKTPKTNMILTVIECITYAIVTKIKEHKTNPKEHWLDYSEPKFGEQLVLDCKCFMNIIKLYAPLPIYFALHAQQGSRWVLQGTFMNGFVGPLEIKPDQLQVLNPLLIMIFIPIYELFVYPLLSSVGIKRPLQKLTLGGILAGVAFFVSGIVELNLQKTYPILPEPGTTQIRVFNTMLCGYTFGIQEIPQIHNQFVKPMHILVEKHIKINGTKSFNYTFVSDNANNCPNSEGSIELTENFAWSFHIKGTSEIKLEKMEEDPRKSGKETASIRFLANTRKDHNISLKLRGKIKLSDVSSNLKLHKIPPGYYKVYLDDIEETTIKYHFENGGSYALFINENSSGSYLTQIHVITGPHEIHLLWLLPQYALMALADVTFTLAGMQFRYTQAPASIKTTLAACWGFNNAVGNAIVSAVATWPIFNHRASEFFIFGGIMFIAMLIFVLLAMRYKYVVH